ncbi:O-antigen/teichoic acid export membrane protein [Paenibacillus phyllosphaerae]|uniref:O-antigen/teichoic acid export membrane protein n=1 Tax=Paenibacillus phyllosphaerae TaxID=274593 RepID=A0A7W5AXD8_9BACL|nr:flippase [Paenibacillus phyllosphaerae]MBB3110555.1 O-antigen/teichoic acid export membrane protein [Paenibacillus phyllosphaerae]
MTNQSTVRKNFLYNTLLKYLNVLFPLITFPYVARVLSAEGIGQVDFSLSVIQYFILFSQLGIPTYAIRECARYRDDKEKLTKTVQEILIINAVMIGLSYLIFAFMLYRVDVFEANSTLLIIMSISIISTSLGIEWFFQAIEDYRYITIRSTMVKLVSLVLVFVLVNQESDYVIYGSISIVAVSLGYVYNLIYANRIIPLFRRSSNYDVKRHIKPILTFFGLSLSISIYANLNKVMLGLISGNYSVGLYTVADKMVRVVLPLVTSLGVVLVPRIAYNIKNGKQKEADELIEKALHFVTMISIPAIVGIYLLAKPILILFAGSTYLESVTALRIISPILIIIALSNLIGIAILVAHGKEKITLLSTTVGAIVNFLINLFLIPRLNQDGAAIGTLAAELAVLLVQLIFAYRYIKGNINYRNVLSYLAGGLLVFINCSLLKLLHYNEIFELLLATATSAVIYFGFLYVIKDSFIYPTVNRSVSKLGFIKKS